MALGQGILMQLGDLLAAKGIDPNAVLVVRHRPTEPRLRVAMPFLAAERPDLYNAYQQVQGEKLERVMLGASYVASFIGHVPGKAVFVGLYKVGETVPLTFDEFWSLSVHQELKTLGMVGFTEKDSRSSILRFELALDSFYADWAGRLVIRWPPPERSWWRRAHRNKFPIAAIHEDSILVPEMPRWDELALPWTQLSLLPKSWNAALEQWRGIYFIFDAASRRGYVGSAYGTENLLGRWLTYASSGHGGNKYLHDLDPSFFEFSILQRVSPDMPADEVIRLEASWKNRLHSRHPLGLNTTDCFLGASRLSDQIAGVERRRRAMPKTLGLATP